MTRLMVDAEKLSALISVVVEVVVCIVLMM